ncbi:MAG: ABC transporter permease [Lachnospiraceae bacterium]|nr:ABC transporter permease [Lachnospiraceae bacterium]
MLNMIQMDVFRMFKTKSLYVIYIVMFVIIVLTTMLMGAFEPDYNNTQASMTTEGNESQSFMDGLADGMVEIDADVPESVETEAEQGTNIGISVKPPTEEGAKVTVYDFVFANLQAKVIAIFMAIFTVLFATADMSSGYIKNFAGQVKNRWKLVLSKAIVLLFFTVLTILLYVLMQVVSMPISFGYLEIGNLSNFLSYLGIQTLLHYGFVCVCMGFAIVFRNNLCSMTLSICICFGMANILYAFMDKALAKIGIKDFETIKYTISGRIARLPMNPTESDTAKCAIVVAMFVLVFVGISSYVFHKRDV